MRTHPVRCRLIPMQALCAVLLLLAPAVALTGCARAVSTGGDPLTPVPAFRTSAPTPAPAPSDADIAAQALTAFEDAFHLDYARYDIDREVETMTELMKFRFLYVGMANDFHAAIESAANAALARVLQLDSAARLALSFPAVDWRLMVALSSDCQERPEAKLMRLIVPAVSYENGVLSVSVSLPAFETLFENESNDVQYDALSIYCYLSTVYDENGEETDSDGAYEFPEGYLATLVEPLPKRNIKDGWYNDRSNASRRHMGTDITAPEGRIIHAVSAGTVLYIGYTDVAGNYVMIADDYGFRYTYCHMVERTTHVEVGARVSAGDIIGNVGNTGNSDAPHLHLSLITPEHRYVNPYPLVAAVRMLVGG